MPHNELGYSIGHWLVIVLLVNVGAGNVFSQEEPTTPPSLTDQLTVRSIPPDVVDRFSLSEFYCKCVIVGGMPIVGSEQVNDAAIIEAAFVVRSMLKQRPDILRQLAANRVRLAVMATNERTCDIPEHSDLSPAEYWNRRARGLGATHARPCVSCAEENVLNLIGDPYDKECVLIHEFAHAIHLMALVDLDNGFQKRLDKCYRNAMNRGLWKGKYAASNSEEYWAEGVQSWFDCNRENDGSHNHVNTRVELKEYDPSLSDLIQSVFRDSSYRYVRSDSAERKEIHLQKLDRNSMPRFDCGALSFRNRTGNRPSIIFLDGRGIWISSAFFQFLVSHE